MTSCYKHKDAHDVADLYDDVLLLSGFTHWAYPLSKPNITSFDILKLLWCFS